MELWRKAFQVTIDAYYAGNLKRGADACEALLASYELPADIELQTRRNLAFYASPLNTLLPSIDTWPLHVPMPGAGGLHNPSVANGGDGICLLVWWSPAASGEERRNVTPSTPAERTPSPLLLSLTNDLDIREVLPIQGDFRQQEATNLIGIGCQGAHLVHYASAWWITSPVDDSADEHRRNVALLRLDGHSIAQQQRCDATIEQTALHQWLPTSDEVDGSLQFVASLSPVQVLSYNDVTGLTLVGTSPGSPLLRWSGGGTQLIPVEGGWLGAMHEVIDFGEGGRTTLHRFVWLDTHWRSTRISPVWVFQSRGAERALGLAQRGADLLISYGIDDRDAWLAIAPLSDIMGLLTAPLDVASAQRWVSREAASAVAAGTLPAPAQPAPVPSTAAEHISSPEQSQPATRGGPLSALPVPAKDPRSSAMSGEMTRDLESLSHLAQENPDDPRGFSRLAEALAEAGRVDEAIAAFRICASHTDDAEMGAWAMYRAAECFLAIDRPVDALEVVTSGMAKHAGLGELPWLAAYASWQSNRPAQAVYWARRAIALGHFAGTGEAARDESPNQAALWEGPFDILRFALRRLGDDDGADQAEHLFREARGVREAGWTDESQLRRVNATDSFSKRSLGRRSLPRRFSPDSARVTRTEWSPLTEYGDTRSAEEGQNLASRIRDKLFSSSPYDGFPLQEFAPDLQGWDSQAAIFKELIRSHRPRRILEVGSWKGASAIHMAQLCREYDIPCQEIVCVDTWLGSSPHVIEWDNRTAEWQPSQYAPDLRRWHGYPQIYFTFLRNVIDCGFQDLITPLPMSSDAAFFTLQNLGFSADLIYIDGSHEYESVRQDVDLYWRLLDPYGVMLGDDYEFSSVAKAVDEFSIKVNRPVNRVERKFFIERRG